jgi:Zn-finger nucleic acid-binding protein
MIKKCDNCGGNLEPIEGKAYLLCEYCFTFHFPDESKDGAKSIGTQTELGCPVCKTSLVSADIDSVKVHHCENCKGNFMDRRSFSRIVEIKESTLEKQKHYKKKVNFVELQREIHCPKCLKPMETHPYYGPGNVIIDSCNICYGVWVDEGELTTIGKSIK